MSPLVAARAITTYLPWIPDAKASHEGVTSLLVVDTSDSMRGDACIALNRIQWSKDAVARRLLILSHLSPDELETRYESELLQCGGDWGGMTRRSAAYQVAGTWSLLDTRILLARIGNATQVQQSGSTPLEDDRWRLAESEVFEPVRGLAPLGALELLSSVAHPGVIEHAPAAAPPMAMLTQPHPKLRDCFAPGTGWEGNAVDACAARLRAHAGDVTEAHHPWLDASEELQPSRRRRLSSIPSVRTSQGRQTPPAAVAALAAAGWAWLESHPLGMLGRITPVWQVAVGVSRLVQLQSIEDCDTARLLAVRPPQRGTGIAATALGLAKALAVAATLNRTLVLLPALFPRTNRLSAIGPAGDDERCNGMWWSCWFEPPSKCVVPSSTLALMSVPWSAIRPHNSPAGSGADPASLLAADVEDDRVVLFDAWLADADRPLLERRWIGYAASSEAVDTLLGGEQRLDAVWATALMAYLWRPLPWILVHPAVKTWADLTASSWKRVASMRSSSGRELESVHARAHTIAAFVGSPADSLLADEVRAAEAVRAAVRLRDEQQSTHVALLVLSQDERSIAATVAEAAWTRDVSAFAVDPGAAAAAEVATRFASMAAMAGEVTGNTTTLELRVGKALSGMFEH